MKTFHVLACSVGIAACLSLPAKAATLLNSTINANIELQGTDDNGPFTVDVFNGPISVGSGFSNAFSFSRQGTYGGFSGPTNVLSGTIGVGVSANAITLNFNGQAQPVELVGTFSTLPAVQSVSETDSGFIINVNEPLAFSFTSKSLTISAFYFGFQPGTNTTQVDTLTFGSSGPGVPEPATWAMMLIGLFSLGAMIRAGRHASLETA